MYADSILLFGRERARQGDWPGTERIDNGLRWRFGFQISQPNVGTYWLRPTETGALRL